METGIENLHILGVESGLQGPGCTPPFKVPRTISPPPPLPWDITPMFGLNHTSKYSIFRSKQQRLEQLKYILKQNLPQGLLRKICIANRNIRQDNCVLKCISVILAFVIYFYQARHLRR